jgi:hypothetical protein
VSWLRLGTVVLLGAMVSFLAAPLVYATEITEPELDRKQFVEQAEPICKQNVLANKRIFQGAKAEVKAGELKRASTHFFRAAQAFGKTIGELAALPRPSADAARIGRWLGLLKDNRAIILKIGRALAAGQKQKASSYSIELNRNSTKANNAVLSFGFDYCRIEPARFG